MTPSEALAAILTQLPQPRTEHVPIDDAPGRILQEPITADRPFPAFDRVMMDGVAINCTALEEGRLNFEISGLAKAGEPACALPNKDACIRVNTGAVLPLGANQVIPIEEVEIIDETRAQIAQSAKAQAFQFVHREGSDFAQGAELIEAGARIGSKEIGVLASVGASQVKVSVTPKITLISTGDELVDVDQTPQPHQIRRSNTTALKAACKHLGIDAETIHLVDEPAPIKEALEQLFDAGNWIILSGGNRLHQYRY